MKKGFLCPREKSCGSPATPALAGPRLVGAYLQIEYVPLAAGTSLEKALESRGQSLLFMGPPGQRVINLHLTGEALKQVAQGGPPIEDKAIRLIAPAKEQVTTAVRALLRLEPAPAAQGDRAVGAQPAPAPPAG